MAKFSVNVLNVQVSNVVFWLLKKVLSAFTALILILIASMRMRNKIEMQFY